MRFLAEQHPSPDMVARLAEFFVTQAIREYVERLPAGQGLGTRARRSGGGRALSVIHRRYAEDLDVELLAREAGVSRTVLGERFSDLLGEPPMRYCGRWRMHIAANMLREGKQSTANVAYSVGFNSEAAFNRAFKREYGEPPATWRKRIEAEEQARSKSNLGAPAAACPYTPRATGLAWRIRSRDGPPIVKTANWLNHIEYDWDSPLWRHWIEEFTCGTRWSATTSGAMASRLGYAGLSFDAFVDDLNVSRTTRAGAFRFACDQPGRGGRGGVRSSLSPPGPATGDRQRLCRGWAVRATRRNSRGVRR